MSWLEYIQLKGTLVTLEPLDFNHIDPLKAAVMDGELWKLWFANVPSPAKIGDYVAMKLLKTSGSEISRLQLAQLCEQDSGNHATSITCDEERGRCLGYTRMQNPPENRLNTESKLCCWNMIFEEKKAIWR